MTENRRLPSHSEKRVYFAIDRGGTFTDVYASRGNLVYTEKLLSSDPDNYADAPFEGIRRILQRINKHPIAPENLPTDQIGAIRMGTTVATNALLERRGTPCALVINRGFGDLLRIGYQNRPDLFALEIIRPPQIYRQIIEIDERVRPLHQDDPTEPDRTRTGISGELYRIIAAPDPVQIRSLLQQVFATGIRSLAVVLMHGYSFPDHELLVGSIARDIGFSHISLSHQIMPRIRIVGRGDTACVDAYLTPHIRTYIDGFSAGLPITFPLYFMQSDGGLTGADSFRGSNAILSGPAGGVVGYVMTTYEQMGRRPVIGFDMGGTSTDVSRYGGAFELVHQTETAGIRVQAPQLDIRTVAAGGGSRLFYRNSLFVVGPDSSGAHPGPVCYRKNGHLSVTDANLLLGRLQAAYFPRIFGPGENLPLDREAVECAFDKLAREINCDPTNYRRQDISPEEVALGFLEVANEVMVRPIREISVMRGFTSRDHVLACFGGAGGQHAVAIARKLGISTVFIHRNAGILSAVGIAAADVVIDRQKPAGAVPLRTNLARLQLRLDDLAAAAEQELLARGYAPEAMAMNRYLNLRYQGTNTAFMIELREEDDFFQAFSARHQREFGFDLQNRLLLADDIRVRATASLSSRLAEISIKHEPGLPRETVRCYFAEGWRQTPVYLLTDLGAGQRIEGPALIIQDTSTVLLEPASRAEITGNGDIVIRLREISPPASNTEADPIRLAVFSNRFMSIAEQMGRVLQKTALSTNIKERLDFSCAVFDEHGDLVANAPHVPVHLGAMGEAVKKQIALTGGSLKQGDVLLSNHPAAGGSHLPDITIITPVWKNGVIRFFVASRGHHSDIGGISPGSMPPFSRNLDDEGLHVRSFTIVREGVFQEELLQKLLLSPANPVRSPQTIIADLKAQVAANQRGIRLLEDLMEKAGEEVVLAYMRHIQHNAEHAVRSMLRGIAASRGLEQGAVLFAEDMLDDGSLIRLALSIDSRTGGALFDFSGTGPEVAGNLNAPPAVTQSAILYCLRCLIREDIPLNQGCLNPVEIILPPGCLLNPSDKAAVVGGNVLTSQRIVDVIFKALQAVAASQGCMNNLAFGNTSFGYYETIGGGSGAGPGWHGCSGVHTHMTNTRITDPEILEQRYPLMLREFSLRRGSGGRGKFNGGDGLVRDIEFLSPLNVSILSERRVFAPYGLNGGEPGEKGINLHISAQGMIRDLGGKNELSVLPGERIRILSPGGGGFGRKGK